MSKLVLPKATTAAREAATPVEGEIFYDKEKKAVYFGDGATAGGISLRAADLSTAYVYGIDHDTSVATAASACTRVVLNHDHDTLGDPLRYTEVDSFSQMPAHNFKRCVMSDLANRTIAYYLNASDSTKKENGAAADLTGGDGDVMVEIPVCHYRIDTYTDDSDHVHHVYLVSNKQFTGSAIHRFFYVSPGGATARVQYVGAFRDVLCDSDGVIKAQPAEDTPASYASGDKFRSIAGARPAVFVSRVNFRAGAVVNGGTNVNAMFGQYLALMMAIDCGTFDSQAGVSQGFTRIQTAKYAAVRKTGRTAVFGNATGEIVADDASSSGEDYDILTMNDGSSNWESGAQADHDLRVVSFSYRGIEDPFGALGCIEDGIQFVQDGTEGYTASGYWITSDTDQYSQLDVVKNSGSPGSKFPDSGYTGSSTAWVSCAFPKESESWIVDFQTDSFYPVFSDVSGASTSYLCDRMRSSANAGNHAVSRGGAMFYKGQAGVFCLNFIESLSVGANLTGARLGA